MTPELVIPLGIAVVAILAAVAAFAIAWRRSTGADWRGSLHRETRRADRSREGVGVIAPPPQPSAPAPPAPPEPEEEEEEPAAVAVATAQRVVEVSPEEAGVSRRMFFNRSLAILFGIGFLGTQALAYLAFLWPKLTGGFGTDVNAGNVNDILAQTQNEDGSVTPVFIPEARSYVVPAPTDLSEQFADKSVAAGGVMALFQRCVHLGCRVPWCETSQGFECPCHGSKYNRVGEYFAGPAPRNLDRFVVEVNESNELVIKTGSRIETPRALQKSVEYPVGPSCISLTDVAEEA